MESQAKRRKLLRVFNICRLCCSEANLKVIHPKLKSSVTFDGVAFSYFDKIEEVLRLKLKEDHFNITIQICSDCLRKVDKFFDFKMMCVYNNIKLRRKTLTRNKGS